MIAALLFLALTARAAEVAVDHEKLTLLGWGDGCSIAVDHRGFPPVGIAVASDPITAKIGVLSIAPGETAAKESWRLSLHGAWSWRPVEASRARKDLLAQGYVKPGTVEVLTGAPVSPERDLPRLLLTTDTLKAVSSKPYPGPEWTWTRIYYDPVASCALLYYERKEDARSFYDYRLVRVQNPAARADRALAHLTNGLIIFENGDLPGALAETAVAVTLAPDYAAGRYHHAALMSLSGIVEPAVDELEVAIKLDPQYKAKARKSKDFEPLRWHPKFKALTQ